MKIERGAVILLLFLISLGDSFGENLVGPTKAEVEAMYSAAAQELNAGNYAETLKKLDALEARQPDVAAAKNLRGVALMRMRELGPAEKALQKAKELDPKMWEARFNLAEVAFLRKGWAEARDRFEALAKETNEQAERATGDLIQFKILLTYLLQGKAKQATELLHRLKASSASPAYYCAEAAFAFKAKDEAEARVNLRAAEKAFPARLTRIFVESFYELGWMEKPEGALPVALEVTSKADRIATAQADFSEAERAYREGDYEHALQLLEEVDEVTPSQAVTYNLRGQIYLAEGKLEEAESALRNALVADPQLQDARYNLARIPFKQGEYEAARRQFEELLGATSGSSERERARAQLIRYQIYLTLLLQGRDGVAQKTMDEFKMTDDLPALYYAQAAWAFQRKNTQQANNWITNAANLFSPELNRAFAAPLEDLGWLKGGAEAEATPAVVRLSEVSPSPTPATVAAEIPRATPAPSETPTPTPAAPVTETPAPVVAAAAASSATPAPATSPEPSVAAKKVASAEKKKKKKKGEDESEESSRPTKEKRTARTRSSDEREEKPRAKRTASRERSVQPTPPPAPTPVATPQPPSQDLGGKVVRLLLYPLTYRPKTTAPPGSARSAPTPSATATPPPAPWIYPEN